MKLIATRPVLIGCTQYRAGDQLPVTNKALVKAWIAAGSAVCSCCEEQAAPEEKPKAVPVAPAGLPGKSSDGDPDALIGKVPQRAPRTPAKKPAAKRTKK